MEEYGFCVSDKRRAVWNAELELFCAFREICDRHNLMYYAEGGTLLGAVAGKAGEALGRAVGAVIGGIGGFIGGLFG